MTVTPSSTFEGENPSPYYGNQVSQYPSILRRHDKENLPENSQNNGKGESASTQKQPFTDGSKTGCKSIGDSQGLQLSHLSPPELSLVGTGAREKQKRLSMHSEPTPGTQRDREIFLDSPIMGTPLFSRALKTPNSSLVAPAFGETPSYRELRDDKPFSVSNSTIISRTLPMTSSSSLLTTTTAAAAATLSNTLGTPQQQNSLQATPTIKFVKPDQSAFKSTGFLSKKHRFYHTSNHQAGLNTSNFASANVAMDPSLHHHSKAPQHITINSCKGTPTPETPSKKATSKLLVNYTPFYSQNNVYSQNSNSHSNLHGGAACSTGYINRIAKASSKVNTSSPLRKLATLRTPSDSDSPINGIDIGVGVEVGAERMNVASRISDEIGSNIGKNSLTSRVGEKTPNRLLFPKAMNPNIVHFDSSSPPPFEAQMFPESPPSPLQQRRSSSSLAGQQQSFRNTGDPFTSVSHLDNSGTRLDCPTSQMAIFSSSSPNLHPMMSHQVVDEEDFMILEKGLEDGTGEENSSLNGIMLSHNNSFIRPPSSFAEGMSMECIPEQDVDMSNIIEEDCEKDHERNSILMQSHHPHHLISCQDNSSSPIALNIVDIEPSPFLIDNYNEHEHEHGNRSIRNRNEDNLIDESPFLSSCGNSNSNSNSNPNNYGSIPGGEVMSAQEEEFEAHLMSSSRSMGSISSFQGSSVAPILWRTPFLHHLRPSYFLKMRRDPDSENRKMLKLYRQFLAASQGVLTPAASSSENGDHLYQPKMTLPSSSSSNNKNGGVSDGKVGEGFEILATLGQGSFADVFQVIEKASGKQFAIKRTRHPFIGMKDRMKKLEEVENLWSVVGHPNIVEIKDSWEHHGHLYIMTELCINGTLESWILGEMSQRENWFLPEEALWTVLDQIAEGLRYIHDNNIIHLDLKPANILICGEGSLKIGDFGLSTRLENAFEVDCEGDKYYMAPEVLEGTFDKAADVFSLGLIVLELAANIELPAQGEQWHRLRGGDVCPSIPFEVDRSDYLKALIDAMLHPIPRQRCTTRDILEACKAFRQRATTSF